MFYKAEQEAAKALKLIARNEQIKTYIQQSPELYPLLLQAAKRYITGETREEGIAKAKELVLEGYSVSLEYIGENTRSEEDCIRAKDEFANVIQDVASHAIEATISLDLSHIGLSVDSDLTFHNLKQLAELARQYNLSIMISMEESAKTDQILHLYKKMAEQYPNVGITIQAHLIRSISDIHELLHYPGKIRIVKGAYQEPSEIAVPRSKALNDCYLQLVKLLVEAEHSISIATHDKEIIGEVINHGYLHFSHVEVEMLYGVRPDLLKGLKGKGYKTRVYLTYGQEWYLYLCHRLAEHPANLYLAVADMVNNFKGSR